MTHWVVSELRRSSEGHFQVADGHRVIATTGRIQLDF
jgi:hypothetical protein